MADMGAQNEKDTFSTWKYVRPDYVEVKKALNDSKNKMQTAASYQTFRNAWLDGKKEIDRMLYQESSSAAT